MLLRSAREPNIKTLNVGATYNAQYSYEGFHFAVNKLMPTEQSSNNYLYYNLNWPSDTMLCGLMHPIPYMGHREFEQLYIHGEVQFGNSWEHAGEDMSFVLRIRLLYTDLDNDATYNTILGLDEGALGEPYDIVISPAMGQVFGDITLTTITLPIQATLPLWPERRVPAFYGYLATFLNAQPTDIVITGSIQAYVLGLLAHEYHEFMHWVTYDRSAHMASIDRPSRKFRVTHRKSNASYAWLTLDTTDQTIGRLLSRKTPWDDETWVSSLGKCRICGIGPDWDNNDSWYYWNEPTHHKPNNVIEVHKAQTPEAEDVDSGGFVFLFP